MNNNQSYPDTQGLPQFKGDNFYSHETTNNDGTQFVLAIHKSAHMLLFAKYATGSQMRGHCLWVDANLEGRYRLLDHGQMTEARLVSTQFVRDRYTLAKSHFDRLGGMQNKIYSCMSTAEKQGLMAEIDSFQIFLVDLLISDARLIEDVYDILDRTTRNTNGSNSSSGSIPDLPNGDL